MFTAYTVVVCATHTGGGSCEGLYRFRWFELSGYEAVSEKTAWKKFAFEPGKEFSFIGISPVKYAKRYTLELTLDE